MSLMRPTALERLLPDPAVWERPADWLPLPTLAANQICILAAVFDHGANYAALTISVSSGTYSVDWGDGSSTTGVSSGVASEKLYDYADADLANTLSDRGYKQAMIVITTSGGNITSISLNTRHSTSGLNAYSNPWLDIRINAGSATTCTIRGGGNCEASFVERVEFVAIGAITSLSLAFCARLQRIVFPPGSLASLTSMASMFQSCAALLEVEFPSGSLASVTTISGAFTSCSALSRVVFPSGALASCTNISSAFSACAKLRSVTWPSSLGTSITTMASIFTNCTSLEYMSFPTGTLGASLTNISSAFSFCTALQRIDFPSSSLSGVTTTTSAFSSCPSLSKITNCAIPVSFSVASARLSGTALDEIYTALPTITSQTITVSTNYGTTTDTSTIASAKGWAITGT